MAFPLAALFGAIGGGGGGGGGGMMSGAMNAGPAATMGTAQMGLGIYQLLRNKKIKQDRYVPPSLQSNIMEAEALAGKSKYIGQGYDESQVRRASANAISRMRESSTSATNQLNGAGTVQSRENDALNAIGQKALKFQEVNRMNAQGLKNQRANFEMDSMKRFWAAKSAMKGAGIQNLMGGFSAINQGLAMGKGGGGSAGNLANSEGGADQNNQLMMSPQGQQYNPIYQSNPQYQYPHGLYS